MQQKHCSPCKDVVLLLAVLYAASIGVNLTAEDMKNMDAEIVRFRETAVLPLRTIRTRLKLLPELPFDSSVIALRQEVKRLELMAEKIEASAIAAQLTKYRVLDEPVTDERIYTTTADLFQFMGPRMTSNGAARLDVIMKSLKNYLRDGTERSEPRPL